MSPRRVIPILVILLLTACGNDAGREDRFVIGMYGVNAPADVEELSRLGFNTIHTGHHRAGPIDALAVRARRSGAEIVAYPDLLMTGPSSATARWPIAAWYLADEPELTNITPEALEEMSRKTRTWDSERKQAFVLSSAPPAAKYGAIADVLMLDWYPVPHLEIRALADQIDTARRSIPSGKPLWMVIQAFDWRRYPQGRTEPRIGRFPDYAEIRFMTYLSIVHGVKGVFYYTFAGRTEGATLADSPEHWQAVRRVVREIAALRPVLEGGSKIPLPFPERSDGIEAKALRYRGRDYLIVLNRAREARPLPRELASSHWRPLYEIRRDVESLLEKRDGQDMIPPLRVLVFESRLRAMGA